MTDFRIGDKVRYIGPSTAPPGLQSGMLGEICHIDEMTGAPYVQFEELGGPYVIFGLFDLEMVKEAERHAKYK